MISIFPLYYKHDYLLNEEQIGWLMALNGVSVAIVEMFLITYIRNKWTQFNFMTVGICLLLGGCANTHTYSKGGSNEALQQDLEACKTVMARLVGDDAKAAMDACMAEKGYEKIVDQYRL